MASSGVGTGEVPGCQGKHPRVYPARRVKAWLSLPQKLSQIEETGAKRSTYSSTIRLLGKKAHCIVTQRTIGHTLFPQKASASSDQLQSTAESCNLSPPGRSSSPSPLWGGNCTSGEGGPCNQDTNTVTQITMNFLLVQYLK